MQQKNLLTGGQQNHWNHIILLAFTVLSVFGIVHHEMWLDEVNCWLTAKESHSFSELITNCHNSGQPFIWNILLFILSRFTDNMFGMQVLHIIISLIAAYIFLFHSPFSLLQKILILFGYYFLFEYNIISRNYNTAWLLVAWFCFLFSKERKNYFLLVISLALLCNVHLFSLILSVPLFIILITDYIHNAYFKKAKLFLYLSIFAIALLLSIISIIPPEKTYILEFARTTPFSYDRSYKAFSLFPTGFFPIVSFSQPSFWNFDYFMRNPSFISYSLLFICFLGPILILRKDRRWLFFYFASTVSIMMVLYCLNLYYGTRYKGYCFLAFIASVWLLKKENRVAATGKLITGIFIWAVLIFQFLGGIYAYYMDIRFPFSEGKETASYIKTQVSNNAPVFVIPSQAGPPVSAYLGRNIFYPERSFYGSSFQWKFHNRISCDSVIKNIIHETQNDSSKTFAIVYASNEDSIPVYQTLLSKYFNSSHYWVKEQKLFDTGLVGGENYLVVIMQRKR